jgi:hypothetical protein
MRKEGWLAFSTRAPSFSLAFGYCCGLESPMRLEFLPYPGGMFDNSPTPKAFGVGSLGKGGLSPEGTTETVPPVGRPFGTILT